MRRLLARSGSLLLAALLLTACSRSPAPGAQSGTATSAAVKPAATPGSAPAAAAGAASEGAPLLTDSADGVHIEYRVYGRGDPAVVLIHGWACSSAYWRGQIDALARRYTVVTLDLAGHGASGTNRSDWSIANYGEDVVAVVKQLSSPRVVLVGHSMGGPVALAAAARLGPRVIGVIGVDTFTSIGLPPPTPRQVAARLEPFRNDFVGAVHDLVGHVLFAENADPHFVRMVADDMSRASPQIAIASLVALNSLDFNTVLPRIHVPIIAIDSAPGETIDEARIRKVAPTFRAVALAGSSHFLMLQDPQRFNPVLLGEIASLSAPQGLTGAPTAAR